MLGDSIYPLLYKTLGFIAFTHRFTPPSTSEFETGYIAASLIVCSFDIKTIGFEASSIWKVQAMIISGKRSGNWRAE
jgi:hypothetical protein